MKTRYGSSPWLHEFPDSRRPAHPRLRGDQIADVVIVGGGLTGCATAYACAVAGLRALVVEAGRIGQGGTGHSAGLLLPEPGPAFRDIVSAHGLRAGRHLFEAWRRASLDSAALIRRLGVRAGLDTVDVLTAAGDAGATTLRRECDARAAASLEARWLSRRQAGEALRQDLAGAMRVGAAAVVDPYRMCLGLAAAAGKRGAMFVERTPVGKILTGRNQVDVIVQGGRVRAQTVIVTTGVPTTEFKPLRRHFISRHRYYACTETIPAAIRKQIVGAGFVVRDTDTPQHTLRWTSDGRLVIAGADQDEVPVRKRDAVLVQRTGQLMYELLKMYPAISGTMPEYGWDLTYADTADGLMYVGPHRHYPRHLFALGGRDSLTGSLLAARVLARAAADAPAKGDELFGWTR